MRTTALVQLWRIGLDPTPDAAGIYRYASFRYDLGDVLVPIGAILGNIVITAAVYVSAAQIPYRYLPGPLGDCDEERRATLI
jgi:hypothetical protein